jgi:protein involved in polysaccharide export with SLBB domain
MTGLSGLPRRIGVGLQRMQRSGTAATLLLLSGFAGSLSAQERGDAPSGATADSVGIQPGDLIRVKVWREPDLSDSTRVDADGNVTLPKLGVVHVRGVSADSVRRLIVTTYSRYLRDPAVDVTVLPRVTILGAVRSPGVRNLDPTMTIADALATAGGAAPDGKVDRVELRRRGERVPARLSLDARLAETPIRSGDQLVVPQRSWLSRNVGVVVGVASLLISIGYFVRRT